MKIAGIPTTVLVAPDAFKGTFPADVVAAAVGHGLEAAGRSVELCPVADGGEGTLEVLEALGAVLEQVAQDQDRPAVADDVERPGHRTVGIDIHAHSWSLPRQAVAGVMAPRC